MVVVGAVFSTVKFSHPGITPPSCAVLLYASHTLIFFCALSFSLLSLFPNFMKRFFSTHHKTIFNVLFLTFYFASLKTGRPLKGVPQSFEVWHDLPGKDFFFIITTFPLFHFVTISFAQNLRTRTLCAPNHAQTHKHPPGGGACGVGPIVRPAGDTVSHGAISS